MAKKLVAYFSASGTTKKTAEMIAEAGDFDLCEIAPKVPYTKADLNWMDKKSRSSVEMADKSIRPEITDSNVDVSAYDEIILGFPIWWYVAPTIVNTFLEKYDLSGKKIVLFATSGGSGFGNTRFTFFRAGNNKMPRLGVGAGWAVLQESFDLLGLFRG